jgi:hypothetical protein
MRAQTLMRLRNIPRAAVGRAQTIHNFHQPRKLISGV